MESGDMKEWEQEQSLERTRNMFHFFFQQRTGQKEENKAEEPVGDRLFLSFSRPASRGKQTKEEFENQFKEFHFGNLGYLREFMEQKNRDFQRRQKANFERESRGRDTDRESHDQNHSSERRRSKHPNQHSFGETPFTKHAQARSKYETPYFEANQNQQHHTSDADAGREKEPYRHASAREARSSQSHEDQPDGGRFDERQSSSQTGRGHVDANEKQRQSQPFLKKKPKGKTRFKKKSDQKSKNKYTKGTDGKWYCKGDDGRWRESGPPPQNTKTRGKKKSQIKQPRVSLEDDKPTKSKQGHDAPPSEEKVYIKDDKGNWYMKVDPPPHAQSSRDGFGSESQTHAHRGFSDRDNERSRGKTNTRPSLPQGLHFNELGEIADRYGRLYERLPDGRFRRRSVETSETFQRRDSQRESLRRPKNFNDRPTTEQPVIFRDGVGNVYMKDEHGNLMKMNRQQSEETHSNQDTLGSKSSSGFSRDSRTYRSATPRDHTRRAFTGDEYLNSKRRDESVPDHGRAHEEL